MNDELIAAAMAAHELPDNPDLSRQVAADLKNVAQKTQHIELCIVIVTALLIVVSAAASTWNIYRIRALASQNRTGVDRIVDCTTQGHTCYEEQQARGNTVVADALLQLNEEHLTIECILLLAPASRTRGDIGTCRAKAHQQTEAARQALQHQLNNPTTTTTIGSR